MKRKIEGRATAPVSFAEAAVALSVDPLSVIAPGGEGAERTVDVTVKVSGSVSLVQPVILTAGVPSSDDGTLSFAVRWSPASHGRTLPSFSGRLTVSDAGGGVTAVVVSGEYVPPLGVVGVVGDSVLGHRVALATVAALADEAADRVVDVVTQARVLGLLRREGDPERSGLAVGGWFG